MHTPVLVAIRDWELRDFSRGALEHAGYRVVTAASIDAAAYVLDSRDPPAAVVVSTSERWREALARDDQAHLQTIVTIDAPARWDRGGGDAIVAAVGQALHRPVADRTGSR